MQLRQMSPRLLNAILGVWLILSSFLWIHTRSQFINAWLVGIFIFLTAVSSIESPSLRVVNTVLAVWLFLSSWAFQGAAAETIWNNTVVAVVVFSLSLTPGSFFTGRRSQRHP